MIYTAIIWCIEMLINNQAITLFTILIIAQITHTVQSIISITLTVSPSANLLCRHSVDLYLMKAVFTIRNPSSAIFEFTFKANYHEY